MSFSAAVTRDTAENRGELDAASVRIRRAVARPLPTARIATSLAQVISQLQRGENDRRRRIVEQIASHTWFSTPLLDASFDALLRPFSPHALDSLAQRVCRRQEVIGFVMAGNAAGAGIHEIALALTAGRGVLIKAASSEPVFWFEFAAALSEIDPELRQRVEVFHWRRDNRVMSAALTGLADLLIVYGDDSTIEALANDRELIGFGSRISGAVAVIDGLPESRLDEIAGAIALDASLYEQLGCLSPHHVFVAESDPARARDFARRIADELRSMAVRLPAPSRLPLQDAAAIRRAREVARWRAIGGDDLILFEGPRLDWTVIFDAEASFSVSPGYRTLLVSVVDGVTELIRRLEPASRYLESMSLAAEGQVDMEIRAALGSLGIPRICGPGEMQSPPLDWRHGGGAFFDRMTNPS